MNKFKIDKKEMGRVFSAPFEEYARIVSDKGGEVIDDEPYTRHLFLDRGGSVLGVAHLDTVQKFSDIRIDHRRGIIRSQTLDNRLGAWLIGWVLPRMGVVADVLFTDNEERGASTAEYFTPRKQYNWVFSFDRGGDDVVLYQHEWSPYSRRLEDAGFKIGMGSYSDIASMDLGCLGVNIGCGMENYHSKDAWCDIGILKRNLNRFVRFYKDNKHDFLESDEPSYSAMYTRAKSMLWSDDMIVGKRWGWEVNEDGVLEEVETEYIECEVCNQWAEANDMSYSSDYDVLMCADCRRYFAANYR